MTPKDGHTVADSLALTLRASGIGTVFGTPGAHNLALFDALRRCGVSFLVLRHEGAAAIAADGHARTRGGPGVVITTTGPGAANAAAGIGEAWAASSPVLHLTTQVSSDVLASGVQRGVLHQSPGQAEMFAPITRRAETVTDPGRAAVQLRDLLAATVSGRPRPGYLEVPHDLLAVAGPRPEALATAHPLPVPEQDVERAAGLLRRARQPVIWAGGGVVHAGAQSELASVAQLLGAPVVTTFMGRSAISCEHPLALCLPPHEPAVRALIEQADVLLAVGTDLDGMTTMNGRIGPRGSVVRIDVEESALAGPATTVGVQSDARAALRGLHAHLTEGDLTGDAASRRREAEIRELRRAVWDELRADPRTSEAIRFLDELRKAGPPGPVALDMCVPGYWCAAYLPVARPRSLLFPMGWGTLGFGLPAAIGAARTQDAPVVAVVGDGGLMCYAGELATVREHNLNLVTLVINDRGYGMLRYDEIMRFGRVVSADMFVPDLKPLAAAFDIPYRCVELGALGKTLTECCSVGGPSVVELRAGLFPPRSTTIGWRAHANSPPP